MLKRAKEICNLQGIKFKPKMEVTVICPNCETKRFDIDQTGSGECSCCGHRADISEVLEIAQEEWQDQHRKSINMMTKRGD